MKNNRSEFVSFIINNRISLIVFLTATLLLHGGMLLGKAIGIDTEALFYYGDDFYQGWLNSGRQGLMLLKIITFTRNFNPYIAGVLTIIMTSVACIMWTYLLYVVTDIDRILANTTFGLIIIAHTIITEQMYFRIQSAEIITGFAFTALAILLEYNLLTGRSGLIVNRAKLVAGREKFKLTPGMVICWIIVLLLNIWCFSIYQVMIPLHIFGCAVVLLLHYLFKTEKHPWLLTFKFAGIFLVSFVINEIITLLFFNGSSYLNNQIYWGSSSFATCLYQIASHIIRAAVLGKRIYFAPTFFLMALILLTDIVMYAKANQKKLVYPIIVAIGCLAAPFYMTILCGGEVVIRSQLVLPFALAFMAYSIMLLVPFIKENNNISIKQKKIITLLGLVLIIVTITEQGVLTLRLNHTDKVRYDADEKLAYSMIKDIDELQNAEKTLPVYFVGNIPAKLDAMSIKTGDVIGYSFFDWDTLPEPYSYHSSLRIIGFMSTLGTTYTEPDTAGMEFACQKAESMANYPQNGSVQRIDDIIIVKLSDH